MAINGGARRKSKRNCRKKAPTKKIYYEDRETKLPFKTAIKVTKARAKPMLPLIVEALAARG